LRHLYPLLPILPPKQPCAQPGPAVDFSLTGRPPRNALVG
jgi:hypothetical protein